MTTKILAIAPYEGMKETLLTLVRGRNDILLTVEVGNLEHGLSIVQEHKYKDYDVIISRGGTAQLIKASTDIPVVEVSISVYDILHAIKMAENYSDKFAIAAYSPITDSARQLCGLLQQDIDIFTIDESIDVHDLMKNLRDMGYGLVLCDTIGISMANEVGLNYILLTSGPESLDAALRHALELSSVTAYQKKKFELLDHALKNSSESVFIYKGHCDLIYTSYQETRLPAVQKMIKKAFSSFEKESCWQFETVYESEVFSFRSVPCSIDGNSYICLFLSTRQIPDCMEAGTDLFSNAEPEDAAAFSCYPGSASNIGSTRTELEQYAHTAYPILIVGEPGTGKDRSASFIHKEGAYRNHPLFVMDCALSDTKKWKDFLEHENSPLYASHVTVYLKNIQRLSDISAGDLMQILRNSHVAARNRLIFSYVLDGDNDFQADPFVRYLMDSLSCLMLRTLPLRERAEDIPSIATVYISQFNVALGKQIVGFLPEALDSLMKFGWKYNLDQFRRIIRELVILTDGFYIEPELVTRLLSQEQSVTPASIPDGYTLMNVNQSMEDINRTVIHILMDEQGLSQSRTAQKLGISRSTLWRMLKT